MKNLKDYLINEASAKEIEETIKQWFYSYGPAAEEILDMEWDNDTNEQKTFITQLANKEFDSLYDILNIYDDLYNQYDIFDSDDEIDRNEKKIINALSKIAKAWLKENK